jgi:hypothetical protein
LSLWRMRSSTKICVMTLFALQCPRIHGLLVLVRLLLLLALPIVVVPPSAPATNSDILKMLRGIFAICRCTDQRLDMMDHRLQIVRRNQEIIHSQQDDPLQEFPDVPVFPPILDPYGSLTPAELAAFGVGPARASSNDDDEAQATDDEETEDDE